MLTVSDVVGTYQVSAYWRECDHPDLGWEAGYGDVAGDMVFGIQG